MRASVDLPDRFPRRRPSSRPREVERNAFERLKGTVTLAHVPHAQDRLGTLQRLVHLALAGCRRDQFLV